MADVYIVPEDIIYNIFLRLPAKPLLRCKCLSKQWNRAISDPMFMKLRSRRMILLGCAGLDLHTMDSMVQSNEIDHSTLKLRSTFVNDEDEEKKLIIGGTFNGIVLLLYSKDMILYNPFTRAFKTFPIPPYKSICGREDSWGFGYGTTSDDLKIVRLRYVHNKICCDVFNLKHGSWSTPTKLIGDYIIIPYAGTFINGFLYWSASRCVKGTIMIMALDLKEMVFSEIQCPCSSLLGPLGTLNGRLCGLCKKDNRYGIWVMNGHGFGRSWTQVYSLPYDYGVYNICILDEGKIVMRKTPNQLIMYDMLKNSYKELYILYALISRFYIWDTQAIEYVESLISPSDLCSSLI